MKEKEQQSKDPSNVDSSRFHFLTPDYDRPLYELQHDLKKRIKDKLIDIMHIPPDVFSFHCLLGNCR